MGWMAHRIRCIPGALALTGMAFYGVLIPWHTVSQATTQSIRSQSTAAGNAPCHETEKVSSKHPQPLKPLGIQFWS
jgi:hypothetical protein